MSWLGIVLLGHLANAGAFVIDKMLLAKQLRHPTVYVFYIGALGLLAVPALLPFGKVALLPDALWLPSVLSGASFMLALLCFFEALKRAEASRVVPFIGALVPLWTVLIAGALLGERIVGLEWLGIVLLIFGAVLISYEPIAVERRFGLTEIVLVIVAGGLFATSFTFAKVVYNGTDFIGGFLWTRLFAFATIVPLLALPTTRHLIFAGGDGGSTERPTPLFFLGQGLGAAGFVLINWGIELAPRVSVVNALQGIQYAFLFLLLMFLGRVAPGLIRERWDRVVVAQKVGALIALAVGLVLVA